MIYALVIALCILVGDTAYAGGAEAGGKTLSLLVGSHTLPIGWIITLSIGWIQLYGPCVLPQWYISAIEA